MAGGDTSPRRWSQVAPQELCTEKGWDALACFFSRQGSRERREGGFETRPYVRLERLGRWFDGNE